MSNCKQSRVACFPMGMIIKTTRQKDSIPEGIHFYGSDVEYHLVCDDEGDVIHAIWLDKKDGCEFDFSIRENEGGYVGNLIPEWYEIERLGPMSDFHIKNDKYFPCGFSEKRMSF